MRRLAGLRLTAALVAHVELVAHERELTRGDADVPRLLDRAGVGVERDDGVLSVDRGVQRGPVGRVLDLADQGGVAVHRRDRDGGRRAERAVGVDREPGQAVLLRKPEELAVRRVRRTFLTDGAVGQLLVDAGCGADRPDELVARQVEDLQDHRLVGAGGREEAPVRADRRAHELADLGDQTVTERLDDLVVGDLDPVGVLGADLVVAEHLRRGVGHPRAGEDDSRGAECDEAESVAGPAEDPETDSRDSSASSCDLHTYFGTIRPAGSEHQQPPLFERPGPEPDRPESGRRVCYLVVNQACRSRRADPRWWRRSRASAGP